MTCNILLYGATGYTGRLIAGEMKLWADESPGKYRMTLAARDGERLRKLADGLEMGYRVFGLDDPREVRRRLHDADVVINAAGPFARTAERLATAAIDARCHYVDVNGEADVYRALQIEVQDPGTDIAVVSGAGFWAAASDVLLDIALRYLVAKGLPAGELGAIRIAMSRIKTFTRASAATVLRSLREEVTVVRMGEMPDGHGGSRPALVLWQEPVGKLERSFDFGREEDEKSGPPIASAASLVDTLTARLTVLRRRLRVGTIESYVEMDRARRFAYQFSSLLAPVAASPLARALALQPIGLLAEGPTPEEREDERHVVVLDIEDPFRTRILDWRWNTPNVYQFTAQLAVAVAALVGASGLTGWRTPAEVLIALEADTVAFQRAYRDAPFPDEAAGLLKGAPGAGR